MVPTTQLQLSPLLQSPILLEAPTNLSERFDRSLLVNQRQGHQQNFFISLTAYLRLLEHYSELDSF